MSRRSSLGRDVRAALLTVMGTVGAASGFGACADGNDGSDSVAAGGTLDPAAVANRAAGGLALGTVSPSLSVVASAAGTPTGDVDLFVGAADSPSLARMQRLSPRAEAVGAFGAAVALSGMNLVVSATHEDPGYTDVGYVDFYQPVTATGGWLLRETITAPCLTPPAVGSTEYGFGRSLDLSGDDVVVGAPRFGGGYGRVFVFRRGTGGGFELTADLQETSDVRRFDAYFGDTVRIQGDTLIVTRPDTPASTGDGSKAGKVYVYARSSDGAWTLQQVLQSPHADGTWDGFGTAAALAEGLLAVRARDEVWLFQRSASAAAAPSGGLASPEPAPAASEAAWKPVWRTSVGSGERGSIALGPRFLAIGDPTTDVGRHGAAGSIRIFEYAAGGAGPEPLLSELRTWTEPSPGDDHNFGARVQLRDGKLLAGMSMAAASAAVLPGAYVQDLGETARPAGGAP